MKRFRSVGLVAALAVAMGVFGTSLAAATGEEPSQEELRAKARKLYDDGNRNEAHSIYSMLAVDKANDPKHVRGDMDMAISCLQNLKRIDEIGALRERVVEAVG